jgi:butyrate kinase
VSEPIRSFEELEGAARRLPGVVVAVAGAADPQVLDGALMAVQKGVARVALVGPRAEVEALLAERGIKPGGDVMLVDATGDADVVSAAVALASRGEASVLLKGMISTGTLLRTALSRDSGLRQEGALLSDVLVCPNVFRPGRPLWGITDGGLNVAPDLEQKQRILHNGLAVMRALGHEAPRVAVLAASEKPDKAMPATLDAEKLAELAASGLFGPCVVEGPLAFDVAVSAEAARHKGVESEVAGRVDLLLAPSIEGGNLLGKSLYLSGRLAVAHVIAGARVPILINSRNDGPEDRYRSILLAMVTADRLRNAGRRPTSPGPSAPSVRRAPADARGWRVLALNPGATSTKLGYFEGGREQWRADVAHGDEVMKKAGGIFGQLDDRLATVTSLLASKGLELRRGGALDAVVGRGGLLPPLAGGTYAINDALVERLRRAERGEHASNLGAPMARALADAMGVPAYIVDPVSVDEVEPSARLTGWPTLKREILSHALNLRAVARRVARELGEELDELRLVGVHLGTGISMAAFEHGRMVDIVNPRDEGPLSADRAGSLPAVGLAKLVLQQGWSVADAERRLGREAGLYALVGTRDLREVRRRAADGDQGCRNALEAMTRGIAKSALGLCAALGDVPDRFFLTGGMAHDKALVADLRGLLGRYAEVAVVPGEDELLALAEGATRALGGEEPARTYEGA